MRVKRWGTSSLRKMPLHAALGLSILGPRDLERKERVQKWLSIRSGARAAVGRGDGQSTPFWPRPCRPSPCLIVALEGVCHDPVTSACQAPGLTIFPT